MAQLKPPLPDWTAERNAVRLQGDHNLAGNGQAPFGTSAFTAWMDLVLGPIIDTHHGPRVAFMPLAFNKKVQSYVERLSFHRDFRHHIEPLAQSKAANISSQQNYYNKAAEEFRIDGWNHDLAKAKPARAFFARAARSFFPGYEGREDLITGLSLATAKLASQWNRKTLFVKFEATGSEGREKELHLDNAKTDYVAIFYLNQHTYPALHRQPFESVSEAVLPPKQSLAVWRGQGLDNASWHGVMGADVTGLRVVIYSQANLRQIAPSGAVTWRERLRDWRNSHRLSRSALLET